MSNKVLITGATGFIGSHLSRRFIEAGWEVGVLLRLGTSDWRIREIREFLSVVSWDGENLESTRSQLQSFASDVVIHVGWTGVDNVSRNRIDQIRGNFSTSIKLLEIVGGMGCKHWIGIGSQAEYGPNSGRIDESAPTLPTTLYGATKLASYHLTRVLAGLLSVRHSWIRVFSTYGPMDNDCWLIPTVTRKLLNKERPSLTKGEQLWDFLHVKDAANAIFAIAANQCEGVFNLGAEVPISIFDAMTELKNIIDPNLELGFGEVQYRQDQVMHLLPCTSRLRGATNWEPTVEFKDGLKDFVNWYKIYAQGAS